MLYIPMSCYLITITMLCFLITKKTWKVILADLLWWVLFLLSTDAFFNSEIRSWELKSDARILAPIMIIFSIIVNSIFIFVQALLATFPNNQENGSKMLKKRKSIF